MRRVLLCVFAVAVVALVMPAVVSADIMIEGESANIFQNAVAVSGPGTASGGESARLWLGGGTPQCTYYFLDAGSVSPGDYNLTVALWADDNQRRVNTELRTGHHLGDDGNWLVPTGYAVPTLNQSVYQQLVTTTGEGWGDPAVYTFASGTDYTLRVQGYGGDTAYLDYMRLTSVSAPEPTTLALVTTGLLALLAYAWRKR